MRQAPDHLLPSLALKSLSENAQPRVLPLPFSEASAIEPKAFS